MGILRWFLSFVGVQFLCGIVWFLGPLVPQLEDWLPRAAIIAGLAVLWAIGNLILDLRRLGREKALVKGVSGGGAVSAESAALQEKLTTAMALLRKAKGKRGALYEQPWYVIIGPPAPARPPPCSTPASSSPSPSRWAAAPSPASAAPGCANGGSPRTRS